MPNHLSRSRDWLMHHPWVVTGFCTGVLTGVAFALPLFSTSLPDGTATLLGSVLGAGIAVGLAAWVAGAKERAEQRQLRRSISFALHKTLQVADEMVMMVGASSYERHRNGVMIGAIDQWLPMIEASTARVDRLCEVATMQPLHLLQLLSVTEVLRDLREVAAETRHYFVLVESGLMGFGTSEEEREDQRQEVLAQGVAGFLQISRSVCHLRSVCDAVGTNRVVEESIA